MPTLDVTDAQLDRIDALKEELSDIHGGPYATVERDHVLTYLLDLADAVDDPHRTIDLGNEGSLSADELPTDQLTQALSERTLQYSDDEDHEEMDLYTMAEVYDVEGRSQMTKDELVDALVTAIETRYTDPLAPVDLSLGDLRSSDDTASTDMTDNASGADNTPADASSTDETSSDETDSAETTPESPNTGGSPLTANLSLLEEHADKWHEGEGDARYEVELPDGSVETARTQDDVRALLFKNY